MIKIIPKTPTRLRTIGDCMIDHSRIQLSWTERSWSDEEIIYHHEEKWEEYGAYYKDGFFHYNESYVKTIY